MTDFDFQHGKYFAYLRKSSESEDKQVASIDSQREELKAVAKREGIKIVEILEETRSAHTPGRPIFNEMILRIQQKEANGILVWHPNRIARNIVDGGTVINLLDSGYLKFIKTKDKVIYNTSTDKFMLVLEFGISKKYSDDLSEVVKRGNKHKFVERKEWSGKPKPGYLNSYDPVTKTRPTLVDPERFPILQHAMKQIIYENYTPIEMLHWLNNEAGYKTRPTGSEGRCKLQKSAFYRILQDSFYYGLMVRNDDGNKIEVMGNYKPMLTKREFEILQMRLGRPGKPKITKHEFAYKGVIKCGECGASVIAQEKYQIICSGCKGKFHRGKLTIACPYCDLSIDQMKGQKELHYIYYGCSKRVQPNCSQKHIQITVLEDQIDKLLQKYEIPEDFNKWALKYLKEWTRDKTDNQAVISENMHTSHERIKKQLDQLTLQWISPENINKTLLSDDQYERIKNQLTLQRDNLLGQLRTSDEYQSEVIELAEKTFNFACYARYWFAHGDIKARTNILVSLGNNLILRDKQLLLEPSKPFVIIEKSKMAVLEEMKKLEPNKEITLTNQTKLPEALSSTWLDNMYQVITYYENIIEPVYLYNAI